MPIVCYLVIYQGKQLQQILHKNKFLFLINQLVTYVTYVNDFQSIIDY